MGFPPPSENQARLIWLAATGLAIAVLVGLLVGLVWGLGRVVGILSPVLWPLAFAAVLACLLDPVVDWLEKRRVPRTRAIFLVFCAAFVIVGSLLASIVPRLVVETRDLADQIPAYATRLQTQAENWINNPPALLRKLLPFKPGPEQPPATTTTPPSPATNAPPAAATNTPPATATNAPATAPKPPPGPAPGGASEAPFFTGDSLKSVTSWLAKTIPAAARGFSQVASYLAAWFGILAGLALVPVYAFYFLAEKSGIESKWTEYLPVSDSAFKKELVFVLTAIQGYLVAFFRGQVLVAICDGVLYSLGFLLIGLDYALLLGCMAIALTMIPFLGAITTCATALVLALVQHGDMRHPLLVLAVFAVVQVLEGLFISPKIMGDKVGLHPVTIIIAVMAGTTLLGGLLGGVLAIPLTAALRVLMSRYIWKRPAK